MTQMQPDAAGSGEIAEVQHVEFNPNPMYGDLMRDVCGPMEEGGWALLRIVPVDTYRAVAVFGRPQAVGRSSDG